MKSHSCPNWTVLKTGIAFLFLFFTQKVISQTTINCSYPSITYDMVTANAARSGATNPTLTTWPFANPFSWETNSTASLNANATTVHGTAPNRTNVFYGSTNTTPADLISNQTFNLYQGPITLTGSFLNFSTSIQYDEAYLSLIPSVYTTAVPVGTPTTANSRVGISVGGIIGGDLKVYDNLGNTTASTTIATYTGVMPAVNTWYTMAVTFDIQGGNIVITDIKINGATIAGFSSPLVVASYYYYNTATPTNAHQWINSVRAVASVDDLLDDFTITTNSCYSISGTVYNDANGLSDNTVNGVGINNPGGSSLTAVLVDENEIIVNKTAIAAGGTYSFSNVPGGIFEVRLTNMTVGAVGSAAPQSSLPDGWINTGENIGAGVGNDGSPNGSIVVGTTGAANVNFGIQPQATTSSAVFDCNTNVVTYDMVSSNAKISNQTNQTATGTANPTNWATVTNNFEWESFATDANLYGLASVIPEHTDLSGLNNPTNVYFGGVWTNASSNNTANVASDFISRQTYALSSISGPITLIGRFLNKSAAPEENESYLFIMPNNYSNFTPDGRYDPPPAAWTKLQRQGIFIGGNITTGLFIVDNMDAATASVTSASIAAGWGGLAPAVNTWWTMSVTFDVQGANLVVTNVSINGTTAAFAYPVTIGTVASHAWLSSLLVGASVDDLMDDFTIATNPCISGNVFYDSTADGTVNGKGIGNITGTQLYVVLVDGSGNIAASSAVASDGTYSFSNVYPANYTIRLTTTVPGAKGSPAPAATLLPASWYNTGENIGAGPGNDGVYDGTIAVSPAAGSRLAGSGSILSGSTSVVQVNFGVSTSTFPLPVRLVKFTASAQGKSIQINWVTSSETNNQYFVVEKSSDGIHWQQLHVVSGKGIGFNLNYYNDVDENPFPGTNFYRLKQVDTDGRFSYSNTVMVGMALQYTKETLLIMPNPVEGGSATVLLFSNETMNNSSLKICDTNGRVLKSYSWLLANGVNKKTLNDLNSLAFGTYFIFITDKNGKIIDHTTFVK